MPSSSSFLCFLVNLMLISVESTTSSFDYDKDCGQRKIPPKGAAVGKETDIFEAPWVALIQRNASGTFKTHCTGVIVTQNHILSAAHCFASFTSKHFGTDEFRIVMGIDDLSSITSATIRDILEVKIMPEYSYPEYYYDVAVVSINTIEFDVDSRDRRMWPICLPDIGNDNANSSRVGLWPRLTAWGKTSENDKDAGSQTLLSARLRIYPNHRCDSEHDDPRSALREQVQTALPRGFDPSVMCAENPDGGNGICEGDSGGPLFIEVDQYNDKSKYYLVGIATGVVDGSCGSRSFPDTFNRIEHSKTLKWVKCAVEFGNCGKPDLYIVVATGDPDEESRKTEVVNWSQSKSCSSKEIEMFPIKNSAGGVLETKPTICGGWHAMDKNIRNECWQLDNSLWIQTSFSLMTKRIQHASVIINNTMIITGGWNGKKLSSTEILKGNKFEDGPDLKVALNYHCMVVFTSKVFIIGGKTDNGRTDLTWLYSNNMEYIQEGPNLTTPRSSHGCAPMIINSKESIIVVGGAYTETSAEYLDTTTNSWKLVAKELPMSMWTPSVLPTPDKNALIIYKGRMWQVFDTEQGVTFRDIITFSGIDRRNAVAFLLPSASDSIQGC